MLVNVQTVKQTDEHFLLFQDTLYLWLILMHQPRLYPSQVPVLKLAYYQLFLSLLIFSLKQNKIVKQKNAVFKIVKLLHTHFYFFPSLVRTIRINRILLLYIIFIIILRKQNIINIEQSIYNESYKYITINDSSSSSSLFPALPYVGISPRVLQNSAVEFSTIAPCILSLASVF